MKHSVEESRHSVGSETDAASARERESTGERDRQKEQEWEQGSRMHSAEESLL
jgi:hypothetical protein